MGSKLCKECEGSKRHTEQAHEVPCVVCGQPKKFPLSEVQEAKETYKCADIAAHEKVRGLWSMSYDQAMRVKQHGVHER